MIDLRKDLALFRAVLRRCATRYSVAHESGVGRPYHPPVTRIDFVYSLGDGTSTPWVYLNLDTKPGAEPDGTPTHPLFDWVEHLEWGIGWRYLVESEGNRMPVVLASGELADCEAGEFERLIGDLLVRSLKDARDQNVLAKLPKAPRCELGVEQYGGGYGWPPYEERGAENLAEPLSGPTDLRKNENPGSG
ncbi:MAG: hypothetical protein U0792_11100 [Gemmataceae bacterium]